MCVRGAGVAKTSTDLAGPSEFPPPSPLPFHPLACRAVVSRTSPLKPERTAETPLKVARISVFALSVAARPLRRPPIATWHSPHARPILRRELLRRRKKHDSSGECHVIELSSNLP